MRMKTGSVYWFKYNKYKHDKTPIALILWPGDSKSLCHAINLNYLPNDLNEKVIQFITKVASGKLSANDMRSLYHSYIKKRLHPVIQRAYRTYKPKEISYPRLVCNGFNETLGWLYKFKSKLTKKETTKLQKRIATKINVVKEVKKETRKLKEPKEMVQEVKEYVNKAAEMIKKIEERNSKKKRTRGFK